VAVALALASAIVYGVADYCGGRATRYATTFAVTLVGQAASLVLLICAVMILRDSLPPASDLWWGAGGGAAGVIGILAFYQALSTGSMSVVAPVTAVISALLPVAVGLLDGERPGVIALLGVAVAVVAIALVSGAGGGGHIVVAPRVLALAAIGGVGFGVIFVFLARTSDDAGLWPLVSARVVSVSVILLVAPLIGGSFRLPRDVLPIALVSGVLDMAANVFYLYSTRHGLLTIVAVVGAMYPASTVCLAIGIDHERVRRSQAVGLGLAALALALVALGRS
jgi:drug/metabolite transporter (DMT)-like permease